MQGQAIPGHLDRFRQGSRRPHCPSIPSMPSNADDALNVLFLQALAERIWRQDGLEAHATRLLKVAGKRPYGRVRARVVQAYAALYRG